MSVLDSLFQIQAKNRLMTQALGGEVSKCLAFLISNLEHLYISMPCLHSVTTELAADS